MTIQFTAAEIKGSGEVVKVPSTKEPLQKFSINLPYIIGGTALGIIILVIMIATSVITSNQSKKNKKMEMKVNRVKRNPSINSTRKHPIVKVIR